MKQVMGGLALTVIAAAELGCRSPRGAKDVYNSPILEARPAPRPLDSEPSLVRGPLSLTNVNPVRAARRLQAWKGRLPIRGLFDALPDKDQCWTQVVALAECTTGGCGEETRVVDRCLADAMRVPHSPPSSDGRTLGTVFALTLIGEGVLKHDEAKPGCNLTTVDTSLFDILPAELAKTCADAEKAIVTNKGSCAGEAAYILDACLLSVGVAEDKKTTLRAFEDLLDANPARIGALLNVSNLDKRLPAYREAVSDTGEGTAAPPLGVAPTGSLQSRALNGLADFLARRAQHEILAHIADLFGRRICEREYRRTKIRSYFPDTCHLLKGRGGDEPFGLSQFGSAVQKALEQDLRGLLPVILNFAVDELVTSGPLAEQLALIAVKATDAPPATFAAWLDFATKTIRCRSSDDVACVLRLMLVTTGAIESSTCNDAYDAGCRDLMKKAVKAAVKADPTLVAWLKRRSAGALSGGDPSDAVIEEVADVVRGIKARGGTPSLDDLVAVMRVAAEQVVPADQRAQIHEVLGDLENKVHAWGEIGYAAYTLVDGVLRGQEVGSLLVAAAKRVPCRSMSDDLGCGLRATGHVIDAALSSRAAWPDDGSLAKLDAFVTAAVGRLDADLKRSGDPSLRLWIKSRFGDVASHIQVTTYEHVSQSPLGDMLSRVLGGLRGLEKAIDGPHAQGADPLETTAQVLGAAAELLRIGIAATVTQPEVRARAERILQRIVEASTAASRRQFATFAAALHALAIDLGVSDPVPRRLRRYVPLVTALVTATSADQVAAAFEHYASPVGGHKEKREEGIHVTLSGLVGGAGGIEGGEDLDAAGHAAAFVPVGFDFTWGGCGACGFFLTILDLGSITSMRFDGDDDMVSPTEPTVAQVFSPGAYVRIPTWEWFGPVTWGVGASAIPGARRIAEGETRAMLRAIAFVAVDIPLLTF
jgi:hypothetical protein